MSAAGLRRPDDVAYLADEDAIYLARVPQGPIQVLAGSAAVIWEEAVDGDRAGIAARVARRTGSDESAIRADVEAFLSALVSLGLLAPEPADPWP